MIYGARVRQARELRGLTQAELAEKVKRDQSLIAHVENGLKEPSDELLSVIAFKLQLPISFFSRPPETQLPGGSLLWRAHASITRKEATEALRHAEIVFSLGVHLIGKVNPLQVQLSPRAERPEEAARHTRMALRIDPSTPIPRLIRTLERAGVWVLPIPKLEGRDAFSIWAEIHAMDIPVVAISVGQPGDRLRYSIAHELGHLVMHKTLPMKTMSEIEDEANQFAAEFLLPARAMSNELKSPVTLTSVARLKPKWGVSMQSIIRRAHDLGIITERQYRYLFQQLSAKGWRIAEPLNLSVQVEKPRLIAKLAEIAYASSSRFAKLAAETHILEEEIRGIMKNFASKEDFDDGPSPTSKVVTFQKKVKV
jgi:Zn-dependent peptidase ImmA (M78 family)/transcriptional regulator with XRE-family HTH domain